jgi:hypothetical protein
VNHREFRRYLDRDRHCLHCGRVDDTLVPQHRANRGMGGRPSLDRPANVIVLCSLMNGLIESDARLAQIANEWGWKISTHEDPADVPVFDAVAGSWWLLGDDFTRTPAIAVPTLTHM